MIDVETPKIGFLWEKFRQRSNSPASFSHDRFHAGGRLPKSHEGLSFSRELFEVYIVAEVVIKVPHGKESVCDE